MTSNRRQFIKQGLAAAMGCSALTMVDSFFNQASARVTEPTDYKSMVCVYLNGGNDSFNMLIPYSTAEYNAYKTARRGIEFDRNNLLPISADFAVNPFMSGLQTLFDDGHASFLANVGTLIQPTTKADIVNGSAILPQSIGAHNTQTNYWQADHTNSIGTSKDGWAGRVANEFDNSAKIPINLPINSGYNLFQSHAVQQFYKLTSSGLINLRDQDLAFGYNNANSIARRNALYEINALTANDDSLLVQHATSLLRQGLELNLDAQTALTNVSLNTIFPSHAASFETAAKMIAIRKSLGLHRQIFYIQMNAFDTHSRQAEIHNRNMIQLSEALAAFNAAMVEIGAYDSVITFTASEFGRTLATNGVGTDTGTDHAWGGNQIVMGGPVNGGQVFGTYPELVIGGVDDYTANAGRMIPTLSSAQYSATLAKWFGVPTNRLDALFPGLANFTQHDLGFIA